MEERPPYLMIVDKIRECIATAAEALSYKITSEEIINSISLSKMFGDISSSVSFRIAKAYSKDAKDVAESIKGRIPKQQGISSISIEGGFINFHLDRKEFSPSAINYVLSKRDVLFKNSARTAGIAMVEYPSVNPNKPWHIGHLRNALIGDVIANLLSATGFEVIRTDYIDDLGLQIAESVWWHIKNNNAEPKPGAKFDHWLGEEYVKANSFINEHDVNQEISSVLGLMEQDGTYESKIAHDISYGCVRAQYDTAFAYGIYHDLMIWESDIVRNELLEKGIEILQRNGFAEKSSEAAFKDCIVINLSGIKELPKEFQGMKESTKVLIRSNGIPTYLAKDIAFHMWKFGIIEDNFKYSVFIDKQQNGKPVYTTSATGVSMHFGPAVLGVNIIDSRQSYPQMMLKLAFKAIHKDKIAENIKHLAYGEVEIESGSLSGRKGTWIGYSADELLAEAESKALQSIRGKFDFSEEEQKGIARSVGLSAIKFEFLKLGIEKKITFSWERALNFEGNSGPYLQYMYARASRILDEAHSLNAGSENLQLLVTDAEFNLIKSIARAQSIVEKSASEYKPNMLVEYAVELADLFSKFYEQCPVLKADAELRDARLALLEAFRIVMKNVLALLGISALERM